MDSKTSLIYALTDAFAGFRSNPGTNFMSSLTVAFSLAIFAFFFIIFSNLNNVVESWGDRTHIVVYVKDNYIKKDTESKVKSMTEALRDIQGVMSISYVSKEEALKDLKEELKEHSEVIEGISSNPLPSSFDLKLTDRYRSGEGLGAVVDRINRFDWVEGVQFGEEWVDKFSSFLAFAKLGTIIIGAFLASAVLFIISNTIRLTVYARREEIEVMRLVGASDTFVKIPFFLEGVLQGLGGGIIALAMLFAGKFLVSLKTPEYLLFMLENSFPILHLSLYLALAGIVMGAVGSLISLRKFLKD